MSFDEFRGHFLTGEETAAVLGCTTAQLAARRDLVKVRTRFGSGDVYPSVQFDSTGAPTPGAERLVDSLRTHLADSQIGSYCTCPSPRLAGLTPLDWLRRGGSVELAVQAALSRA